MICLYTEFHIPVSSGPLVIAMKLTHENFIQVPNSTTPPPQDLNKSFIFFKALLPFMISASCSK
jgi:hypothetical protein